MDFGTIFSEQQLLCMRLHKNTYMYAGETVARVNTFCIMFYLVTIQYLSVCRSVFQLW